MPQMMPILWFLFELMTMVILITLLELFFYNSNMDMNLLGDNIFCKNELLYKW